MDLIRKNFNQRRIYGKNKYSYFEDISKFKEKNLIWKYAYKGHNDWPKSYFSNPISLEKELYYLYFIYKKNDFSYGSPCYRISI